MRRRKKKPTNFEMFGDREDPILSSLSRVRCHGPIARFEKLEALVSRNAFGRTQLGEPACLVPISEHPAEVEVWNASIFIYPQ